MTDAPVTAVMRFTFPDGEEQEHPVPLPLPRVVELVQRREYEFGKEQPGRELPELHTVRFRLVHFADNTGRSWAEYHVDR